jgi:hypothetical protein
MLLGRTGNTAEDDDSIKYLWFYTICKDGFVVFVAFLLILFEQLGVYNNCWCRASWTQFVDLNYYSPDQLHREKFFWAGLAPGGFVITLVLALWILLSGNRRTSVICRSQDQLIEDAKEIFGHQNNQEKGG